MTWKQEGAIQLSNDRFNRSYKLDIQVGSENLEFKPPLKVQFDVTKSIYGQLNKMSLTLYNLNENNRKKLVKDPEDSVVIPISLSVGYVDKIEKIFKGTIFEASSERSGTDFVTTIESIDGGHDMFASYTSQTVIGKDNSVKTILESFSRIKKGKITEQNKLIRPKVLVGNSIKLLEEQLNEDETFFIDDERLYIITDKEVLGELIPVVNSDTGLINQPQRANKIVSFDTMLNPSIKIGGRVDLQSKTALHLVGIYKIETITYKGDNYGSDWIQSCSGRIVPGAVEI